jgi:hypothetical protein
MVLGEILSSPFVSFANKRLNLQLLRDLAGKFSSCKHDHRSGMRKQML